MQRTYRLLFIAFFLSGCSLIQKEAKGPPLDLKPRKAVFLTSYDKVWRAVQIALAKYPMKTNNQESGLLETQFVDAQQLWTAPHTGEKYPRAHKYKIRINAVRGQVQGRKAVSLRISKLKYRSRDLFGESDRLPSDGFVE